jgi:hypothetical protein
MEPHLDNLLSTIIIFVRCNEQVEEKELDTAKVSKAMTEINASQTAAREAQRQRLGLEYALAACFQWCHKTTAREELPLHARAKRS